VGLDRVLGDEEPLADLPVAQAFRDEPQDLVLARSDSELLPFLRIDRKGDRPALRNADLPALDTLGPRPLHPEVEAQGGEEHRHQPPVDLTRIGADEVLVFENFEQRKESSARQTIEEDALHRKSIARTKGSADAEAACRGP